MLNQASALEATTEGTGDDAERADEHRKAHEVDPVDDRIFERRPRRDQSRGKDQEFDGQYQEAEHHEEPQRGEKHAGEDRDVDDMRLAASSTKSDGRLGSSSASRWACSR